MYILKDIKDEINTDNLISTKVDKGNTLKRIMILYELQIKLLLRAILHEISISKRS